MAREVAIHCSIYIKISDHIQITNVEEWAHEQLQGLCGEDLSLDYQFYDAEEREI